MTQLITLTLTVGGFGAEKKLKSTEQKFGLSKITRL